MLKMGLDFSGKEVTGCKMPARSLEVEVVGERTQNPAEIYSIVMNHYNSPCNPEYKVGPGREFCPSGG
jgi:hypothetical protein